MVAEVIINSNVKNLNKTFDYKIPTEIENDISIGSRVLLPFGGKKQLEEAYVVGIKDSSQYLEKLKEIAKVEEKNAISLENIQLAKYMAKQYFCNVSDCIKLMLPPGTTTKNFEKRINDKLQNFVYLNKDKEDIKKDIIEKKIKSEKQVRALDFLMNVEDGTGILNKQLQELADVSASIVKTLEKNGYIKIEEQTVERNPFIHKVVEKSYNLILNEEQKEAFEKINASLQVGEYDEFLLFGVTGSR